MNKYKVTISRKGAPPHIVDVFARSEEEACAKAKYDIATNSVWALMSLPSLSVAEKLKELHVLNVAEEKSEVLCEKSRVDVELFPQYMSREELLNLVDEKVNEIFLAYQESNGIESGDISPEDAFALDELQKKMVDLIISVCEKNKSSVREDDSYGDGTLKEGYER